MNLADVMDGLAALAPGDNAYAWPAESVSVPCTVIGYPERVTFDLVYGEGADRFEFPVWRIVGKTGSKAARDALSEALSGLLSLKTAFEVDNPSFADSVRCTDAEVSEITVAAVTYLGIKLSVEVVG